MPQQSTRGVLPGCIQCDEQFDIDAAFEAGGKPVTQPGDLVELGEHRLKCGDSTNPDDVRELMDGHRTESRCQRLAESALIAAEAWSLGAPRYAKSPDRCGVFDGDVSDFELATCV